MKPPEEALVACLDVDYRETIAIAAGVWLRGWIASEPELEVVTTLDEVAPYQPGEFYRRELPCLLAVLERGPSADVVVVDGYVWLGPGRPGLGAHLYQALGERMVVVGVAKSRFLSATDAVPVYRGNSRSPLYVTAAGVSAEEAAGWVAGMHGDYRVPSMLRRVDQLARGRQHARSMP
ncbi:MAG TPA: endonuclease V [Thermoanaerobaculia bacterium]